MRQIQNPRVGQLAWKFDGRQPKLIWITGDNIDPCIWVIDAHGFHSEPYIVHKSWLYSYPDELAILINEIRSHERMLFSIREEMTEMTVKELDHYNGVEELKGHRDLPPIAQPGVE